MNSAYCYLLRLSALLSLHPASKCHNRCWYAWRVIAYLPPPDCAQAWPTLRQVMTHYGPDKLLFTAHWFPLPYHTFSFLSAHAAQTIKAVNGTDAAVFSFADAMFGGAQQVRFSANYLAFANNVR